MPFSIRGILPRRIYYRRMEKIPDSIGTAANVQAMVFGNMGDTSGTGVGFTRNPSTGEKIFYGEFLVNAQGEDVVAGIRTPQPIAELKQVMPEAYRPAPRDHQQSRKALSRRAGLRIHHRRRQAVHAADAQRKAAPVPRLCGSPCDMVEEGLISKKEAVLRVAPTQLDQLAAPGARSGERKKLRKIATRPPLRRAPPWDARRSLPKTQWRCRAKGPVVLVRKETTPDDIHGMDVSKGYFDGGRRIDQSCRCGGAGHGAALRGGRGVD